MNLLAASCEVSKQQYSTYILPFVNACEANNSQQAAGN